MVVQEVTSGLEADLVEVEANDVRAEATDGLAEATPEVVAEMESSLEE